MLRKLGPIISVLVFCQIAATLVYTGWMVIFNSNLRLWLSPDYFRSEKEAMILGGDYVYGQRIKDLPPTVNILAVTSDTVWFTNYYFFPRKLFWYEGVTREADFKRIPPAWLRERGIDYVLFYRLPNVRLEKINFTPAGGQ